MKADLSRKARKDKQSRRKIIILKNMKKGTSEEIGEAGKYFIVDGVNYVPNDDLAQVNEQ